MVCLWQNAPIILISSGRSNHRYVRTGGDVPEDFAHDRGHLCVPKNRSLTLRKKIKKELFFVILGKWQKVETLLSIC